MPPESIATWRELIEPSALALETALMSLKDWGSCPACEKPYPDGLTSHLQGKKHYDRLWAWCKGEKEREDCVQWWVLPGGLSLGFCHRTGAMGMRAAAGPSRSRSRSRGSRGGHSRSRSGSHSSTSRSSSSCSSRSGQSKRSRSRSRPLQEDEGPPTSVGEGASGLGDQDPPSSSGEAPPLSGGDSVGSLGDEAPVGLRDEGLPTATGEGPSTSEGEPSGSTAEEVDTGGGDSFRAWLLSLDDGGGILLPYLEGLQEEFEGDLRQIKATRLSTPTSDKPEGMVESCIFEALGMENVEHRMLLAKGICQLP